MAVARYMVIAYEQCDVCKGSGERGIGPLTIPCLHCRGKGEVRHEVGFNEAMEFWEQCHSPIDVAETTGSAMGHTSAGVGVE